MSGVVSKGYNPNFDIDLAFGVKNENELANILQNAKIEVKTEREIWVNTDNIVIETRYKGEPSGISTTTADYWAHILSYRGNIKSIIMFPVKDLKRRIKTLLRNGKAKIKNGGDNNESQLVIIPLTELLTEAYKGEQI